MLPNQNLEKWFLLEDRDLQRKDFPNVFESECSFDGEVSPWNQVEEMIEVTEAFDNVCILYSMGNSDYGTVVMEARDNITHLWHRGSHGHFIAKTI